MRELQRLKLFLGFFFIVHYNVFCNHSNKNNGVDDDGNGDDNDN